MWVMTHWYSCVHTHVSHDKCLNVRGMTNAQSQYQQLSIYYLPIHIHCPNHANRHVRGRPECNFSHLGRADFCHVMCSVMCSVRDTWIIRWRHSCVARSASHLHFYLFSEFAQILCNRLQFEEFLRKWQTKAHWSRAPRAHHILHWMPDRATDTTQHTPITPCRAVHQRAC